MKILISKQIKSFHIKDGYYIHLYEDDSHTSSAVKDKLKNDPNEIIRILNCSGLNISINKKESEDLHNELAKILTK